MKRAARAANEVQMAKDEIKKLRLELEQLKERQVINKTPSFLPIQRDKIIIKTLLLIPIRKGGSI